MPSAASSLYEEWGRTIEVLKSTGDKRALKVFTEDLIDLHTSANDLLDRTDLTAQEINLLQIVTSRSVEQWLTLIKTRNVPLMNSY